MVGKKRFSWLELAVLSLFCFYFGWQVGYQYAGRLMEAEEVFQKVKHELDEPAEEDLNNYL